MHRIVQANKVCSVWSRISSAKCRKSEFWESIILKRFITYKVCWRSTGKQIINQIPINRIFVESDGPFTKVLGRKYTVEKLSVIYEELACVKKIDEVDVLKRQVTHNYLTLIKEVC